MNKDTEVRPWWRVFLSTLIGFVLVSLVVTGLQCTRAHAMTPPVQGGDRVAPMCRHGEPCMAPYSPRKGARKFRHHKIKNSAHVIFGPRVMHKIERTYYRDKKHGRYRVMARDHEHWWEKPFHETQCLLWQVQFRGRWGGNCRTQEYVEKVERLRKDVAHTTHVWIGCSAKVVVGAFTIKKFEEGTWKIARRGWWGVGAGSFLCLFYDVFDKWWG